MRTPLLLLAIVILQPWTPAATSMAADGADADFYVATDGNDSWSGTLASPTKDLGDGPFRTLRAARDAIRQLKQSDHLPTDGVTVAIAPGVYTLAKSFALTKEDSGSADSPITYRASAPGVRLVGGKTVEGFKPIQNAAVRERLSEAAADAVVELHLPSVGVTDFGHIAGSGFGRREPLAHLELFLDGAPTRLAEWPNDEWTTVASVPKGEKIVDSSGKPRGTLTDRFNYDGDRPKRWKSLDDVWVHGYWFVDWADQYLRVKAVDTASSAVVIEPPQSQYGYKKGQRFRFLNVLEELDTPGEYYLDRKSGTLYVWPPGPIDRSAAMVSLLAEPLIRLRETSHVHLEGLTLECGRSDGVVIEGGQGVLVAGCCIRNLGGAGVRVVGGLRHRIQSCDLAHLGDGGIYLEGGSRQTLTPAGHTAENNHIHDYSRWVRTYRVGVRLSGVGLRAAHNYIHDAPHTGISYSGNDHLIERNELCNLCQDTGDVGSIYTGRDWAARGTEIRSNHIHHLGGLNMGSNAIYLDDLASGQTIRGNVIHHVWRAMMIGGGRDNLVQNNIFADYKIGIHFDARGIGWSRKLIEGRQGSWDMFGRLESVPYDKPPYSTKYPGLKEILDQNPLEPKNNQIVGNIFVGQPWLDPRRFTQEHAVSSGWVEFKNNLIYDTPGLVDFISDGFRFAPDSTARRLGFSENPLDGIGLKIDEFRPTLP